MLTIRMINDPDNENIIIELDDNGIKFTAVSERSDAVEFTEEGLPFTVSSPSFLNLSETVIVSPLVINSMNELYNQLLNLAQKGE